MSCYCKVVFSPLKLDIPYHTLKRWLLWVFNGNHGQPMTYLPIPDFIIHQKGKNPNMYSKSNIPYFHLPKKELLRVIKGTRESLVVYISILTPCVPLYTLCTLITPWEIKCKHCMLPTSTSLLRLKITSTNAIFEMVLRFG